MSTWPLLQGRCIDGAPTLRIPLCAGECPSPLTSANTRLTEPRETGVHCVLSLSRDDVNAAKGDTHHDLTRPAASYKSTCTPSGTARPPRGPMKRAFHASRDRVPSSFLLGGAPREKPSSLCHGGGSHEGGERRRRVLMLRSSNSCWTCEADRPTPSRESCEVDVVGQACLGRALDEPQHGGALVGS